MHSVCITCVCVFFLKQDIIIREEHAPYQSSDSGVGLSVKSLVATLEQKVYMCNDNAICWTWQLFFLRGIYLLNHWV